VGIHKRHKDTATEPHATVNLDLKNIQYNGLQKLCSILIKVV